MIENDPSISHLISSLPFQKNNYEFLSVLGVGGSSIVFKVKSLNYESMLFAAKVTPKANGLNLQDFNALKTLMHSYIISIFDYFEDENNYFLILEYCENGSLASLIKSGQLSSNDAMNFYMKKLTEVISFCHSKGIAHRDIKPSNVLLDSYWRPKLIDFGICEMLYYNFKNDELDNVDNNYYLARKKGNIKMIRKFFGSAPYLAPEIILKESYDPFSSDVWSLGITFYEIVTGSLPWSCQSEKIMNDSICQASLTFPKTTPNAVQQLIRMMTQVDPTSRPTMKSIAACSLFQADIQNPLKFSNTQNICQQPSFSNDKNEENSDKKLSKLSKCVTFTHFDSFVSKEHHQSVSSNLVLKSPGTKKRRQSYATSSAVFKPPVQNKMTFVSNDPK